MGFGSHAVVVAELTSRMTGRRAALEVAVVDIVAMDAPYG